MAKTDDRKILSSVRAGGEVYGPGREDDLAAALNQEELDRLVESGALEGTWKGGASAEDEKASSKKGKK